MLDVTVGILSYNRPAYLREAVHSVLSQTKLPNRIVIYDNGSEVSVFEGVSEFLEKGVEWMGAEFNHPFIWNFSRAMLDSRSKYTMLLHDDDRLCQTFLEEQAALMDSDDSITAISCNGYLIDEAANRTGNTLTTLGGEPIELHACGAQVALKYAANSCIPFSPTLYRTEIAHSVKCREEFGKVCDAVYFCDLAGKGSVAYNKKPLYECRIHSGQDSSHFPYDLMNQLEEFYWTRTGATLAEKRELHGLLVRQHTARNIKQFFLSMKMGDFALLPALLMDDRFRFTDAAKLIGAWCIRNVFRKR